MGSVISSFLGGGAAGAAGNGEEGDSSSGGSHVQAFHSSARWQLHLKSISDNEPSKLVVVDFAATWCGPCKLIEPAVHAMADKFTDVSFAKIDVDELPDVAESFKVQAMPTFVLWKNGVEVGRVVGAKKEELEKKILQHKGS